MMAAITAAKQGSKVILYEKNEKLGKKLFITGKGRCNLTNAADMETLFESVVTNSKFLYSAFYAFNNQETMNFFQNAGCPTKIERGGRVFPVSDHSSDVLTALTSQMKKWKVDVKVNVQADNLLVEAGRITGVRQKNGESESADAVIIATGGLSYPLTGSTGDGYRMAAKIGHTVTETCPSLVPFNIKESWCTGLQGLSLKNVGMELFRDENKKKVLYSGFGEMLFTHYGVSGPLVLSASSYYAGSRKKDNIKLALDLKPALSREQLDRRLLRDFEENINKQFKNSLGGLFPAKLIPIMIELSGIDENKKVNEVTREERRFFINLIKRMELRVIGTRNYEEAVITRGGIHVKEIYPSTMESRLVDGLYFAGEVLDLDALTGGFNLQIAWSTAYLAGISAAGDRLKGEKRWGTV